MVVAVTAMGVMQMPAHHVIEVVPVRRSLVSTLGPVSVLMVVTFAIVAGRAIVWVSAANRNGVFIDVAVMNVVQMTIMKIVGVSFVTYRHVPAAGFVHVIMLRMLGALTFFHIAPFKIKSDWTDAYNFGSLPTRPSIRVFPIPLALLRIKNGTRTLPKPSSA
jgi:hypothetical protein